MTILQRIQREPAALLGFATAVIGILTLTGTVGVELGGSIVVAIGAAVGLLHYVVTPAAEVVVQEKPDGQLVAGAAAIAATGTPLVDVELELAPEPGEHRGLFDERGATDVQASTAVLVVLALAMVLAALLR